MLCKPGFYFRFKNNVFFKKVSGESKAVTTVMVVGWNKTTLPTLLCNNDLQNIYNAEEFGFCYQCLPDISYQFKTDKCLGGEHSKTRIGCLADANAVGNKLPMFVIGKVKNPSVLKTLRNLPVDIDHEERAGWIVFYLENG